MCREKKYLFRLLVSTLFSILFTFFGLQFYLWLLYLTGSLNDSITRVFVVAFENQQTSKTVVKSCVEVQEYFYNFVSYSDDELLMYFLLVRMVISSFHLCIAYISLHAVGVSPGQCWLVQSAIYSVFSVCLFLSRASLPSLLRVFNLPAHPPIFSPAVLFLVH